MNIQLASDIVTKAAAFSGSLDRFTVEQLMALHVRLTQAIIDLFEQGADAVPASIRLDAIRMNDRLYNALEDRTAIPSAPQPTQGEGCGTQEITSTSPTQEHTMSELVTLSITDVAIICKTAKSTRERTRTEAWNLLQLTLKRIKAADEGKLVLAEGVRTPLVGVRSALRAVYKLAHAQWKAAKAAEATAATTAEAVDEDVVLYV